MSSDNHSRTHAHLGLLIRLLLHSGLPSLELILAFFLLAQRLDVCTRQTCKHKIFFILGIYFALSKFQDTVIAIACEACFFIPCAQSILQSCPAFTTFRVSSVESLDRMYRTLSDLDQNVRNVSDPIRT